MDPNRESEYVCNKYLCPKPGFCGMCGSAAFRVQSELRLWTASRSNRLLAGEPNPKFSLAADAINFTCIICKKRIFPPVLQCENGHLACIWCCQKDTRCPTCYRCISRIKNVAIETIMTSATGSCRYTRLGCTEVCNMWTQEFHEEMCSFQTKLCPMPRCDHAGFENRFPHHLKSEHKLDIVDLKYCTPEADDHRVKAYLCLDSSNSEVLATHEKLKDPQDQSSTSAEFELHFTSLLEKRLKRPESEANHLGGAPGTKYMGTSSPQYVTTGICTDCGMCLPTQGSSSTSLKAGRLRA